MNLNASNNHTFHFNSLSTEVTVGTFRGSRQLDLNSGVTVHIKTPKKNYSLEIACNNFKSEINTNDNWYKKIFMYQAVKINKLIKRLEKIQQNGSQEEQVLLENLKDCISNTCKKSLSWALEETKQKCNVYQFIVLGKRLIPETFELVDANSALDFP